MYYLIYSILYEQKSYVYTNWLVFVFYKNIKMRFFSYK